MKKYLCLTLLVGMMSLGMISTASALNVQHFRPATGATKGYQVQTSDQMEQGQFAIGLVTNYAQHMLTFRPGPNLAEQDIVDDMIMLDFLVEVGLFDWLDFYLDVPIAAYHDVKASAISSADSGTSFGDILARLKFTVFNAEETGTGLGLAFVTDVSFPSGSTGAFVGDRGVTGAIKAVGDWQILANRLYLNAGFRFRQTEVIGPSTLTVGNEFLYGLGFQRPIVKSWDLDMIVEAAGMIDTKQASSQDGLPLEFLLMAQKRFLENKSLALTAGGGFGATEGYGSPRFRVLLGLAYIRPMEEPEPEPVERGLVRVEARRLAIGEKIHFAFNKAAIRPESFYILDEVVTVLNKHTDITMIEVQGHTDAVGSDSYNQRLSERRAQAVVNYLTSHGVDGGRLQAKGYGESKPIDTNDTDVGRANNRRTEFIILERQK